MHAIPSLTTKPTAFLTAHCLSKSSSLTDVEDYLAKYLAIPDEDSLAKLLRVKLGPLDELRWGGKYDTFSMLQPTKLQFGKLATQGALKEWLFALFFMLALPGGRPSSQFDDFVASPLNFTIFFHIIQRLNKTGYPSHWLSDVLCDVLTKKVKSTARPPRMEATTVEDFEQGHSLASLSTAPFVAEIAALCTMFRPSLPFRFESDSLPVKEVVYRYTASFPGHHAMEPEPRCLVLWFYDEILFGKCGLDSTHLRSMLDPSPGAEIDARYYVPIIKTFIDEGVAIWTVIECNVDKKIVIFYAHKGFVDKMVESDWCVGLLRTDTWSQVDGGNARAKDIVERETWDKGSYKP